MEGKRKSSGIFNRIKNFWRGRKIWQRVAIVLVLVVCVVIGAWAIFTPRAPERTVFKMEPIAIGTRNFMDDNSASFISGDGTPDVNNNRAIESVPHLTLQYNWISGPFGPAFEMGTENTDIAKYIKMVPFVRGKWETRGSNTIEFIPESDWPANTKFRVRVSKKLFNHDAAPDTTRATFTTPDITANIDSFNVYPSTGQKSVIASAIISFNYAIDVKDLKNHIVMRLNGRKLDFDVRVDRFYRTAIITTEPIAITNSDQTLRMKINRIYAADGSSRTKKLTARTNIASADNFFKISSIETVAADDNVGNSTQMILLNMTAAAANNTVWSKYVHAYLLPQYADPDEEQSHEWSTDEVTPDVINKSRQLILNKIDFATPVGVYQYAFAYDVSESGDRYIYVDVANEIQSVGGFVSKDGLGRVMRVPYPTKSVKIAGGGALLAMGGEQKLTLVARGGVDTAYVNLYKVKASDINHLISQTYNVFADNMEFKSWTFSIEDMASVFQKKIPLANIGKTRAAYASLNLGDYLDRTNDKTGIFIIRTAPDADSVSYSDMRMIMMTNLGIIRKQNMDETSTVFVANLDSGDAAGDVEISVLGRNGNPIWAGRTDETGRADVPAFPWSEYRNEKEPVAMIARRDNDVSFIPYNNAYETRVDFSKFDTDGQYTTNSVPLNAFVFSDRGIYRPGETAIIATIIKTQAFKSASGVPVKIEITDPRGRVLYDHTVSGTTDGMFDRRYDVPDTAATGEYTVRIYSINSRNRAQDVIGTTTFNVSEFVPDNLKINAKINDIVNDGWIGSTNITASVNLRNLFGTPATNKRIRTHVTLRPIDFVFQEYPGYTFTSNFISGTDLSQNTIARTQTLTTDLSDVYTDDAGNAQIDVKFDNIVQSGTYLMTLNINGFEGNSGKSVQTTITGRVSDLAYLIGYRSNAKLEYLHRGSTATVNLIALDNTAAQTTTTGLTTRVIKREKQTTLIKDYNNYYKYQTITNDKVIAKNPITISRNGTQINLDTTTAGTYFVQVLDADEHVLANIEYFVAGAQNDTMDIDKNADMQIRLNAHEYTPGDIIEISLTAPYSGAGLITIERDRVYAYKWFKTDKTSTIQRIKLPDGIDGTAYINVSFVRDITSPDVFTTPYAYAVAPLRVSTKNRTVDIKLDAPDILRERTLNIGYSVSKPSRVMIFAVNSGILQVAKYKMPNPIEYFFPKSALRVETYQILSFLLPEYKVFAEYGKTGGGDFVDESELSTPLINPFGRKTTRPVAFYSGIIDATTQTNGTVSFTLPEYFNGSLRVFAVAAGENSVGSANVETLVQSPVVLTTTTPLAVAPGDKFDISTIVSNLTTGAGDSASAQINASVSGNLIINGNMAVSMPLPENTEGVWNLNINAGNSVGNADIMINAAIIGENGTIMSNRASHSTLSVRPITAMETHIQTGTIGRGTTKIKKYAIDMRPEMATRRIYISNGADAMVRPLFEYLNTYEHPCTEQLVSRAIPYVVSPSNPMLGTVYDKSQQLITNTINQLKNRQNDDGSFDLWAGDGTPEQTEFDTNTANLTAYVTQFLTLAKQNGFVVPKTMLSRANDYLRTFAAANITSDDMASATAFAIYVITRNGYITTSYIDSFEEYANKNIKNWQTTIMGAYIAASYKMLKQTDKADRMIQQYKQSKRSKFVYNGMFNNNVANDAIYTYIRGAHFDWDGTPNDAIIEYINSGNYSSYTSAMVFLGMHHNDLSDAIADISVWNHGTALPGQYVGNVYYADIPGDSDRIDVKCPNCDRHGAFYTIAQRGFANQISRVSDGLEISREYYAADGRQIKSGRIGDIVTTKIFVRTRGATDNVSDLVITDLLPGGFIPDTISGDMDFSQIREDRVLVYTHVGRDTLEISYTAQLGTAGVLNVPPIRAMSMANPAIRAVGTTDETFTVLSTANE